MQLSDFSFELPDELIARYPLETRSASRLLHLDAKGQYHDHMFTDIIDLFEEGDLLVLNDTKVMKARLKGKRATGGAIEILVERMLNHTTAYCHIKASNSPKAGAELCWCGQYSRDCVAVTKTYLLLSFHNQFCQYLSNMVSYLSRLTSIVKQKQLTLNAIKRFSIIQKNCQCGCPNSKLAF